MLRECGTLSVFEKIISVPNEIDTARPVSQQLSVASHKVSDPAPGIPSIVTLGWSANADGAIAISEKIVSKPNNEYIFFCKSFKISL